MKKTWKRLSFDKRVLIQAGVNAGYTQGQIAKYIGVSKATVCRELKRNSIKRPGDDVPCPQQKHGLCNKCTKSSWCTKAKRYYDCTTADEKSKALASQSRRKSYLSTEEIKIIDEIVSDGVIKGQSIYHIYLSNPELKKICCENTIRRLVYRGALSVKKHELRRYVRFKHTPKKQNREIRLRDVGVLFGRSYSDYLKYVESHPKKNIVQYDSLLGKKTDRKAILTITFPKYGFQFGVLILKYSAPSVLNHIRGIFKRIGDEAVKKIFPINISDNGAEFSYFNKIEANDDGEVLCRTYFTSPYKATDKAECERLHELVRYVLPKGRSLDSLDQKDLNELFSHINSYVRKSQQGQTPYDLVKQRFGIEFLNAIGIKRIPKKKVRLVPII